MTQPTANPSKDIGADYIRRLRSIKEDRAKMAALRRGLSTSTIMDAWPIVASLGGDISEPQYIGLASLFAMHPEESADYSFGETCRKIALPDQSWNEQEIDSNRFLPRFRRLVSSDTIPDLIHQLRYWIQFASHNGIGVNYISLFRDLRTWQWSRDKILVNWAKDFYQTPKIPAVDKKIDTVNR